MQEGKKLVKEYIFVCIGTNKILTDSFGPRVGEKLENKLKKYSNIKIYGTMKFPIHLKNAPILCQHLKKYSKNKIILIDSAFGRQEHIGKSFVTLGGTKIGNAYGNGFYFPASLNIKTVIGTKSYLPSWNIEKIDILAEKVADHIGNYKFNY